MTNNPAYDSPNHFVPGTPWLPRYCRSPDAEVPELSLPLRLPNYETADSPGYLQSLLLTTNSPDQNSCVTSPFLTKTYPTMETALGKQMISQDGLDIDILVSSAKYTRPSSTPKEKGASSEQVVPSTPVGVANDRTGLTMSVLTSSTEPPSIDNCDVRAHRSQSRAYKQMQRTRLLLSLPSVFHIVSAADDESTPEREQQLRLFDGSDDDVFM